MNFGFLSLAKTEKINYIINILNAYYLFYNFQFLNEEKGWKKKGTNIYLKPL